MISLTQLTQMKKLFLHCVSGVKHFLCSTFEIMTNPFDQFANMLKNPVYIVLLWLRYPDWSVPLFDMLCHCVVSWKFLKYASSQVMTNPFAYFFMSVHLPKITFWHFSQLKFPSACFRKFAKCVLWFVMSPNYRITFSSWKITYILVFKAPSDQ